ncbi:MAG: hypothetical protein J5944_12675 [Lentisphaeria bacterium]|nr:hypothetical protein [Lentisphaeria bacterium]
MKMFLLLPLVFLCLFCRADGEEARPLSRFLSEEPLKSALEKAKATWNADAPDYSEDGFQDLIGILKDMPVTDFVNLLAAEAPSKDKKALILAMEEALPPEKYLDLISILLERTEIDDGSLERILFPWYSNRGILSLNYQNSRVRKLFPAMKKRFSTDPVTEELICKIENGMGFAEVLDKKSGAYFDSFRSFPMLDRDRKWEDVRIITLVVLKYGIDGFINSAETAIREGKDVGPEADIVQFREYVRLYRKVMNEYAPVNRTEALTGSGVFFDEDSHAVDPQDPRFQDAYRALKSGRTLLFSQILETEDDEIRRMSIDALYLTILSEEDMRTFLSLLTCGRKEVREYVRSKVRLPGEISLGTALTVGQIKGALEQLQKERERNDFRIQL